MRASRGIASKLPVGTRGTLLYLGPAVLTSRRPPDDWFARRLHRYDSMTLVCLASGPVCQSTDARGGWSVATGSGQAVCPAADRPARRLVTGRR